MLAVKETSHEEAVFRSSLREFVAKEIRPHVSKWEEDGALPREFFELLGEHHYLGIRIDEASGGSGLDFRFTAAFVEELVRCGSIGVPVSILTHAEFATKVIDRVGTPEQKQTFLEPAVRGDKIGSLGVTEPDTGSDVGAIRTRAVRDGDDYVINGAKTFITNGTISDYVTTAVRTGGPGPRGLSMIVIPTDAPGFARLGRLKKLGTHASDTAQIAFDDCRVPARYLLGEENQGFKLIMGGFEGERLVLALIACSQMRLMWEEAKRYGQERIAFGHPLLGFQVWQHRLADVLTTIEAAQSLTYRAMDMYVRGEPCNAEISMAKLFATESSVQVAHECAQIFGGSRYMQETAIARLQLDSLALTVGAGTSEVMREIIAKTTGLTPTAGAR